MAASTKTSEPSPWAPFEDRRRARDEKKHAVLRVAAQLFLEVGYHRTTLNEVAARLNITKPALYNYFGSKEEILDECYQLGQQLVDEVIAAIEREGGDGLGKLRKFIRAYARMMTMDFGMCLVRLDDRELSAEAYARVRAGKRKDDHVFRSYIKEGIADGSILPCDPKLSTYAIAGSLNWIGHWYRPQGGYSPEDVADEFAIRLTEGLAAQRAVTPGKKAAPKRRKSAAGSPGNRR